jgi:hypothetical protein
MPRTLEDARPGANLYVLACLYSEDHAVPLIDLLEASGSSRESPVSLIVLHLTELIDRAASVLKPHRKSSSTSNPTHHDVCSLAHSRKANLILLPFHKSSDGTRSTANNAIRSATGETSEFFYNSRDK